MGGAGKRSRRDRPAWTDRRADVRRNQELFADRWRRSASYDRLIGETAVVHSAAYMVTWNVGHIRTLFPDLRVVTLKELAQSGGD